MSQFQFITEWAFDAPIERIWAQLTEPERFPDWWPGFERAEVISGEKGEIGSVTQYRVGGDFGLVFDFTMTLEELQKPEYLFLRAAGDFVGTGTWRLQQIGSQTAVTYTWEVEVQRWWVRLLSRLPGARKYLQRSHDRVMATGGDNLAKWVAQTSAPVARDDCLKKRRCWVKSFCSEGVKFLVTGVTSRVWQGECKTNTGWNRWRRRTAPGILPLRFFATSSATVTGFSDSEKK